MNENRMSLVSKQELNNVFTTDRSVDARSLGIAKSILNNTCDENGISHFGIVPTANSFISRVMKLPEETFKKIETARMQNENDFVELNLENRSNLIYHLPYVKSLNNGKAIFNKKVKILNNSAGIKNINNSVSNTSLGTIQAIDTLTYIKQTTIQPKYYEVDMKNYVPLTIGEGAFATNIDRYAEFYFGDLNTDSNWSTTGANASRRDNVDIGLSLISAPTVYYINKLDYNIIEVQQAAIGRVPQSLIAKREAASMKKFALSHQQMILGRGLFNSTKYLGLANLDQSPGATVLVDTTTIPKFIAQFSPTEYQAFVAKILTIYRNNSNGTALPDTFVIPEADYFALFGATISPTFPIKKMGQDLLEVFKEATKNPNFQILPNRYFDIANDTSSTPLNSYALYRKSEDVMEANMPVPLQSTAFNTYNGFEFESVNFAQATGLILYRDREIVYFRHNAVSM